MGFLKDFYSSKDTIKREKSDQKIFLIHICNKELIQRISKELVQIHKKTKGKLSEKGQKAIKTPPQGDGGSSGSQVTRKTGRQPQQRSPRAVTAEALVPWAPQQEKPLQ